MFKAYFGWLASFAAVALAGCAEPAPASSADAELRAESVARAGGCKIYSSESNDNRAEIVTANIASDGTVYEGTSTAAGSRIGRIAADGKVREFTVTARIDTPEEVVAFRHGGILPYVVRQLVSRS